MKSRTSSGDFVESRIVVHWDFVESRTSSGGLCEK